MRRPTKKTAYKKAGVCPKLQEDLNCTRECNSDRKCPENLKCCRAGCASVCHMPNGNPRATSPGAGRGTGRKRESLGSRKRGDSQTQGPLAKSRRMGPDRPELSPCMGPGTQRSH